MQKQNKIYNPLNTIITVQYYWIIFLMIYTEPTLAWGPSYKAKTAWTLSDSHCSSTTHAQACFHSCAHASAHLLSFAFICFRLLSSAFTCARLAFTMLPTCICIHPFLDWVFQWPPFCIAYNGVNKYTLYTPTKPQTRHNIYQNKVK